LLIKCQHTFKHNEPSGSDHWNVQREIMFALTRTLFNICSMLGAEKNTRQRRHEKTKRYILSEAKKLIRKNGVDKFSLRGLAAACDYSPAALYEYFSNKEALLATIAKQIELDLREYLVSESAELDDLIKLGAQYIAFAKNQPEDYLLLFMSFSSGRKSESDVLPENSAYMVLVNLITELVNSGQIVLESEVGVEEISYNYWVLLHGHVMMQLTMLRDYKADFESIESRMLSRFVASLTE
jgi:AcrR family transcriptional regulator